MNSPKSFSDQAIVLNRIEYGEKDRIITVLTKNHGKLKAIAKAVRGPKSKLAGGIELFAENNLTLIIGKSSLCTLRSSRMAQYFSNIVIEVDRTTYGYHCLKNVEKLTVDEEGSEYYPYLLEVLRALNNQSEPLAQVKIWFSLKLLELRGVSPNLKTLSNQQPIPPNQNYNFDFDHQCFSVHPDGKYTPDHIKILRYFNGKHFFNLIDNCPGEVVDKANGLISILINDHAT